MKGFAEAAKEYSIDFTYDFEGGMFGLLSVKKNLTILMMQKMQTLKCLKPFSKEC